MAKLIKIGRALGVHDRSLVTDVDGAPCCCGPPPFSCTPLGCGYDVPAITPTTVPFNKVVFKCGPYEFGHYNQSAFINVGNGFKWLEVLEIQPTQVPVLPDDVPGDDPMSLFVYNGNFQNEIDPDNPPTMGLEVYVFGCGGQFCRFIPHVYTRFSPNVLDQPPPSKDTWGPAAWVDIGGGDKQGTPGVEIEDAYSPPNMLGVATGSQIVLIKKFLQDPFYWAPDELGICTWIDSIDFAGPGAGATYTSLDWSFEIDWPACEESENLGKVEDPTARAVLDQQLGGCNGCGG